MSSCGNNEEERGHADHSIIKNVLRRIICPSQKDPVDLVPPRFLIGTEERENLIAARKPYRKDFEKLETTCREIIDKENNLINDRLTWYLNFEGFLFAGAGFASGADRTFIAIISVPGCLAGISVLFSIWQAKRAIEKMQGIMEKNGKAVYPLCGLEMEDSFTTGVTFFMPKYFLPVLLTGTWISVFIVQVTS